MREGKLQSHYRFENINLKLQFTFLLEFMTWDRKSVLCVSCEPADAYCLVKGLANGCWFDGLQSSAILLHHNVPDIFLLLFQSFGDSFHFFTGTSHCVLEVIKMWMQVV